MQIRTHTRTRTRTYTVFVTRTHTCTHTQDVAGADGSLQPALQLLASLYSMTRLHAHSRSHARTHTQDVAGADGSLQPALQLLASLYGMTRLQADAAFYLECGAMDAGDRRVHRQALMLCNITIGDVSTPLFN